MVKMVQRQEAGWCWAAVNVRLIAEGTWLCNVKNGGFTVQARYVKKAKVYYDLKVVKTIGQAEVNKFWGDKLEPFEFNLSIRRFEGYGF